MNRRTFSETGEATRVGPNANLRPVPVGAMIPPVRRFYFFEVFAVANLCAIALIARDTGSVMSVRSPG